jgi:hypothetical protein
MPATQDYRRSYFLGAHDVLFEQFLSRMYGHTFRVQLIRAVCRAQYDNRTTFMMNRGALAQLRAWMKTIPRKVFLSDLTSQCTLTTDACTTGGGYVFQRQGANTLRMAFPWRKPVRPDQMGVYELRSIAIGLTNTELENASITIVTDSTIAIGGLQNGYSPSAEVNSAIRDIYEICQKKNIRIVDVRHVNTEDNIADELSRAVKHSNYSEHLPRLRGFGNRSIVTLRVMKCALFGLPVLSVATHSDLRSELRIPNIVVEAD